jgi:hypothetical protein
LTWVGRLTWIVVLAAGGALTLLWLSARHGDAPGHSFDLISYDQRASPDLQVAASSAKNDLARAPQSTMPLPRAVDLLSRPTSENERHPGRDLTTGARSPAAGPDHIDLPPTTEMQDAARPSETRMTSPAATVPSFGEAIPDRNAIAALVARGRKSSRRRPSRRTLGAAPAALAGDSVAALTLGETYDPVVLKRLGVIGLLGDPAQARDWYRKAAELGSGDAPQRLEQLANQLDR